MAEALLVALNAKFVHTALAVRSLASYLRSRHREPAILELTINDHFESLRQAVYENRAPVVAFSCYLWNIELMRKLAEALRCMAPETFILFGGPEVSFDAPALLHACPYLDGVITGEGEKPLLQLLECGGDYASVENLVWRDGANIVQNPVGSPLPLADIPFVYDLDNLPSAPRILYYESSRGCPFRCGFCLSGGTHLRFLPEERAISELTALAKAGAHQVKLVDRTFNADRGRANRIWRALSALDTRTNFHFEIAASLLDGEALEILCAAPKGRFQLEIGVQTTNPETLQAITRPDSFEEIAYATRRLREADNMHLHLDLIAGLPHEDLASFGKSFDDVFALRPHILQLGFLKFLKGSRLRAQAGSFGGRFGDYPPYEVLSTDCLSPDDLHALKACEEAVERMDHSGFVRHALAFLLEREPSPFAFFMELGVFLRGRNRASGPMAVLENLWAFAQETGRAAEGLRELLLYDWLLPEKRGMLPACLECEPCEKDALFARNFLRDEAAALIGYTGRSQAWRICHLHIFPLDMPALLRGEEPIRRRCAMLFDYVCHTVREVPLRDA